MNAMTKTQMVNACTDYEVEWFFTRDIEEQREVYRHIQMHGFKGFKEHTDEALFSSCVHSGVFLMEE
jgi:hypothetical protein